MDSAYRINLCFHGIGVPGRDLEPGEDAYWISPGFFGQTLDYAANNPCVHLSFDDGNASDVDIALPELQARNLRAAFFPVAARLGRPGSLDGAGLRALVDAGMSVGSHGMHHVSWRGLDDAALDEELVTARSAIAAEAGAPVTLAACPLGSYDRRVLSRLRHLGYARAFTSDRDYARATSWLQPRYSVCRTDSITDIQAIAEAPRFAPNRLKSVARIAIKRWR